VNDESGTVAAGVDANKSVYEMNERRFWLGVGEGG